MYAVICPTTWELQISQRDSLSVYTICLTFSCKFCLESSMSSRAHTQSFLPAIFSYPSLHYFVTGGCLFNIALAGEAWTRLLFIFAFLTRKGQCLPHYSAQRPISGRQWTSLLFQFVVFIFLRDIFPRWLNPATHFPGLGFSPGLPVCQFVACLLDRSTTWPETVYHVNHFSAQLFPFRHSPLNFTS